MIIKNAFLKIGPVVKIIRFDSIDDVINYFKNEKNINVKVIPETSTEKASVLTEWGTVNEDSILVENLDGDLHKITEDEFNNEYIYYGELPTEVFNWLNSALCQHMSLSLALGNNTENNKTYNFMYLTKEVKHWLSYPENQRLFAKSMIVGPLVNFNQSESLTNIRFKQLSLL